jgi:hypothetical protein
MAPETSALFILANIWVYEPKWRRLVDPSMRDELSERPDWLYAALDPELENIWFCCPKQNSLVSWLSHSKPLWWLTGL